MHARSMDRLIDRLSIFFTVCIICRLYGGFESQNQNRKGPLLPHGMRIVLRRGVEESVAGEPLVPASDGRNHSARSDLV